MKNWLVANIERIIGFIGSDATEDGFFKSTAGEVEKSIKGMPSKTAWRQIVKGNKECKILDLTLCGPCIQIPKGTVKKCYECLDNG